jgi:hypothetical protein
MRRRRNRGQESFREILTREFTTLLVPLAAARRCEAAEAPSRTGLRDATRSPKYKSGNAVSEVNGRGCHAIFDGAGGVQGSAAAN